MKIVIMGPQGSGKGTQATLISKELDIKHVSMGDVLRDVVKNEGENFELIRDAMKKGDLIPDDINNKAVKDVLKQNPKGVILDGYPRNTSQAQFLVENSTVDLVIALNISDEEAVKRIGKRRICTANNKIFIQDKITQKDIDECEALGGKIIQREDDEPESVLKRLNIYHEKTTPVLDVFKQKGIRVEVIPAEGSIQDVFLKINDVISSWD